MLGRAFILLLAAAASMYAASADPNRDVEKVFAGALTRGETKAVVQMFDPAMAAYSRLRTNVEQLLANAEVSLVIDTETGVWDLTVTAKDVAAGVTERKVKVELKTAGGRIESFVPADFLAPPNGRAAWDAVYAFAASLNDDQNPPALLQFDPAMPGFDSLQDAVRALWSRYQVNTSLDLQSNEGDDAHRTLLIAWTLTLQNQDDSADSHRAEQTVECRVDKQAKGWRIVSFSPKSLFDMPSR